MEDNVVVASLEGRDVGHISVPHISFHFSQGVYVPLTGIAAVGVDDSVRRLGIAAGMMQHASCFAREQGHTCSAVSTDVTSMARRLYARTGNVHLLTQYAYVGEVTGTSTEPARCSATVRPFCADDEAAVLDFVKKVELPYFGTRQKVSQHCGGHLGHLGYMSCLINWSQDTERPEPVGLVAEQDGGIVGFCDCFAYGTTLEADLYVASDDRLAIADALLYALTTYVSELAGTQLRFSMPECDRPLAQLLWERGYRPQPAHVFMFNILDLSGLLHLLRPLFDQRASALASSVLPQRLTLQMTEGSGTVVLGGSAAPLEVRGTREVITRVLCGTMSAGEAYLRGALAIQPQPNSQAVRVVEILLPAIPCHHPSTDRW